jgi:5-methyltetrahydropteroyltriglutamate--homocysteine methyltransferase
MTITIATLGFPRIGPRRELKTALESHWSGATAGPALREAASGLRAAAWARQYALGVDHIPSNDFSLYDHVLDTSAMVGAVPARFRQGEGDVDLATYFAMARGERGEAHDHGCTHAHRAVACEMTKWFDTNYHYIVPEFVEGQPFSLSSRKPVDEFLEAKALGYHTRPVLLGPVTYLKLGKAAGFDPIELLPGLLPVYETVLRQLAEAGADWVQVDEPWLVLDLDPAVHEAFRKAYQRLADAGPKLMLTTYFGPLGDNLELALSLPVHGLQVDLVRGPEQLDALADWARPDLLLSLGVIDGRNVWRADLSAILERVEALASRRPLVLAPSCSLLHTPLDVGLEDRLDPEVRSWLAFAVQKIEALKTLKTALVEGREAARAGLEEADAAVASRRTSAKVHDQAVKARLAAVDATMTRRGAPFERRQALQQSRLNLPPLPTTTIGSFPQTAEVRQARAAHAKGALEDAAYTDFLRAETRAAVEWQEEIGLDVLVHGEFERNDMVQYFGEQLSGFAFTRHAWVQSYGSRCVRPPILYGDVSRPRPMTVEWWRFAQSLTKKPMKGMLTGPVTILQWSFVRDDLPRSEVCRQIALAVRDEVLDLEAAGAAVIQIDEAALREGLPLRRGHWSAYLDWAVECFHLAADGVGDATQIHTHMCYSEFNDIMEAIAAMDADVISIETARSRMELLEAFERGAYPNEIGPGVYDIHAPRAPTTTEMADLLARARRTLSPDQLWVNPDCGLKTRRWEEVRPALVNMVEAARLARQA